MIVDEGGEEVLMLETVNDGTEDVITSAAYVDPDGNTSTINFDENGNPESGH